MRSNYSQGSIEQIGNTLAYNRDQKKQEEEKRQIEMLTGQAQRGDRTALQTLMGKNPQLATTVLSTQKTLNDLQKQEMFEDAALMMGLPHDQRMLYMQRRVDRLKAQGRDPTESVLSMQESPESFDSALKAVYDQGVQTGYIRPSSESERFGLNPIYGQDDQGNTVLLQSSNMGGVIPVNMPPGVTVGKDPVRIDVGDSIVLLDPVSRSVIGQMPKNVTPDNKPENVTQRTLAQKRAENTAKEEADAPKAALKTDQTIQNIDSVITEVDNALDQVGFFSSGLLGKTLSGVPGTDAYDLNKVVTTVKANLGFDRLQAMRDASPTGGALGQVAIQELEALQASVAAIDVGQSREQLVRNINKVKQHYQKWRALVKKAGPNAKDAAPKVLEYDPETGEFK